MITIYLEVHEEGKEEEGSITSHEGLRPSCLMGNWDRHL